MINRELTKKELVCSFCKTPKSKKNKLITGPDDKDGLLYCICYNCVRVISNIIRDEDKEDGVK